MEPGTEGATPARWTAKRKRELVLRLLRGETTLAAASRAHGLPPSEIRAWREAAERGMENALRARPRNEQSQLESELRALREAYGEATLELRARKKLAALLAGPTGK